MKKFLIFLSLIIFCFSCGHKKAPTGGEKDTKNPEILAISPEEYSDISKVNEIEVIFSKPIERNSIKTGISIFPPILERKYDWSGGALTISWLEELQDSTNYFFSFSQNIRGEHGNLLDKNYIFIFRNGQVEESSISGTFNFEDPADRKKTVTLSVNTADSLHIFTKKIDSSTFKLENLNRIDHVLQAYVDKNDNSRYDPDSEPHAHQFIPKQKMASINLELTYQDTTKPKITNIVVESKDKLRLNLSEQIASFSDILINTTDSLEKKLPIVSTSLEEAKIFVVTSKMDTLKYKLEIKNMLDLKSNKKDKQTIEFRGSTRQDSLAPKLVEFWPPDGASVDKHFPEIVFKFDEMILKKDIKASLQQVETNQDIQVDIIQANSRKLIFTPMQQLQNYSSYLFELIVADPFGNKAKIEKITFITIVR
ncbi:MAG: Ig-like domain-containing protein [Candidatus Cloacimonadota bacterium]|nr:Ig-like domain-containing protein [Candidatus Cloacimonadota bacterium]